MVLINSLNLGQNNARCTSNVNVYFALEPINKIFCLFCITNLKNVTYIVLKFLKRSYTNIPNIFSDIKGFLQIRTYRTQNKLCSRFIEYSTTTEENIWWIEYCINMVVNIPCDEARVGVGATACLSTPNWRSTDTERTFTIPTVLWEGVGRYLPTPHNTTSG